MSAIHVSPTDPAPSHDVSLTDGVTTVGLHLCNGRGEKDRRAIRRVASPRTSLQIQQGDPDYSGFTLPYTPVTQKDWSGGRGQGDFKRDSTRYYDGYQVDTVYGDITLGPLVSLANGLETTGGYSNYSTYFLWDAAAQDVRAWCSNYVPGTTTTIRALRFRATFFGSSCFGYFTPVIYADNAGSPGAAFATGTPQFYSSLPVDATTLALPEIELPITCTLTGGTTYYLGLIFTATGITCGTSLAVAMGPNTGKKLWQREGAGLTPVLEYSDKALYCVTVDAGVGKVKFFDYQGQMMAIRTADDWTSPKLFQNGFRNFAQVNSSQLQNTVTNWDMTVVGSLAGSTIKIIAGTGFNERQTWRIIVSNTNYASGNTITVSPPWTVAQDTTTQFIIINNSIWSEVTGHSMTGPITDVLVVGDFVYFAQGDTLFPTKGRVNPATGAWAFDAETDAKTKCTFMDYVPAVTAGATGKIWLAQASTSNVYSADVKTTWPDDLAPVQSNGSKPCGNSARRITNLIPYGDNRVPYILKEDGLGSIANDIYAEIPNAEMSTVPNENNGRAACVYGVYLFFSMLRGNFERYYEQRLDDLGPTRDEGLPANRLGPIVAAIPYPGGIYAAIDGGTFGYSSIMFWSSATGGWHEKYRAPYGRRISDFGIQAIPSMDYQIMWFNQEQQIYWMPVAINPRKAAGYPYAASGSLVTSWYKTTMGEIVKFWRDIQLFSESLSATETVTVTYQYDDQDDSDTWYSIVGAFDTSPVEQQLLTAAYTLEARRVRFKITLARNPANVYVTPRVIAYTVNVVTRVPQSVAYGLTFQADDVDVSDADGSLSSLDMDGLLGQLETWSDSGSLARPLYMESVVPRFHGKYVFLDMPSVSLREVALDEIRRNVKSIASLNLTEA